MGHRHSTLFRLTLGFVLAVIVLPLAATATAVFDSRPRGLAAREWVSAHSSALPRTLSELNAYPVPYRRAIFVALPARVKAELWRAHFNEVLRNTALLPQQRDLINRALGLLTEDNFGRPADAANPLAKICQEIKQIFGDQAAASFGTLGSSSPGRTVGLRSAWLTLVDTLRQCA